MLFNSIPFAVFFLITLGLYYAIPQRFRWWMLLAASYFFYAFWKLDFIFLLLGSTLVNYLLGRRMAMFAEKQDRKIHLWLGVSFNIGILFLFKYVNFFSQSLTSLFHALGLSCDMPLFHLLLPVGISFYCFQSLGYIVDVYHGRIQAERHLGIFALFVSFWPQLLAGPINRASLLMPQFRQTHTFDYQRVTDGLRLMLWGLVKKVALADQLAIYVNRVFNHVGDHQGIALILAIVFYTIQIYCDFSGYTDMARGGARVLGYEFMENFRHPYFSRSLREFWQRWHISLSTWFRDYLYIPLGGNRAAPWRWHFNLFITFVLSGLWHGANWTFVIWGTIHGGVLVLENATRHFQERVADRIFPGKASRWNHALQTGITMVIVSFAWLFFRADSVGDAFNIIGRMGDLGGFWAKGLGTGVVGPCRFLLLVAGIAVLFWVEYKEQKAGTRIHEQVGKLCPIVRWTLYTLSFWAVFLLTVFGIKQEFIYFQF
ncbi:MAG: MBOAT family O-acyltransferase [Pseudomonadota bacterium]